MNDFQNFAVYRDDVCIALITDAEVHEYFDVAEAVGTMTYTVVVNYAKANGETCQSDPVSVSVRMSQRPHSSPILLPIASR